MNFLRKLGGSARGGGIGRHAPLESSTGADASSPHSHFSIDDAFDIPEDDVEANIIGGGQRGNYGSQQQRAFVAAGARANGGRRHLSSSGSGAGEVIPEEEDEEEETPIIK